MRYSLLQGAVAAICLALNGPFAVAQEKRPISSWSLKAINSTSKLVGNSTFQQFVDHDHPELGTFTQHYIYDATNWKGPGSPVIFSTDGEAHIESLDYSNETERNIAIASEFQRVGPTTTLAKRLGAAAVTIEHRYFGKSNPVKDLSTANMRFNTPQNAIADNVNFARNAVLPFDSTSSSAPSKAPWVFIGGSMSGAIAAWTEKVSPGTFWSYWASSATTEGISSWSYTIPISEHMPQNCSLDVSRVIDYVDGIGQNGTAQEKKELQQLFGLGNITHFTDFASSIFSAIPDFQYYDLTAFYDFCDIIENVSKNSTTLPGPDGVGLEKALAAYAEFTRDTVGSPAAAKDTYNPTNPVYTNIRVDDGESSDMRSYEWWECKWPIGYDAVAPPPEFRSIMSRFVNDDYMERICNMYFPEAVNQTHWTYEDLNRYTGGWSDHNSTRLLYISGDHDPWFHTTPSSRFRPGGPMKSTEQTPVLIVPGGHHCADLASVCDDHADCKEVRDRAIEKMVQWVSEFPKKQ